MDRKRAVSRLLTGAAFLVLFAGSGDVSKLPISEARWLSRSALPRALLVQPSECLTLAPDPARRQAAAVGRTAFRAPLLLGGQAARAGLSCASCHRNGRTNPDFHFPGLSGAPGTADVTSSLMSKHRGDGIVNPRPIPDLAAPAALRRVERDRHSGALEKFIHGLIVEEFDGPEPPSAVLAGLAEYVRDLRPEACAGEERIDIDAALRDVETAIAMSAYAFRQRDRATALVMLGAARSALGRIDERFRLPGLESSRAILAQADRELQGLRDTTEPDASIMAWERRWPARKRRLRLQEPRSLFSATVLRRHMPPA